ncbi:Nucleoside triphosphate pyrophosphohydrolase [Corynebacterium cystitidis DSM 20524]|uniref:XTP/dITP diphosphohydrolase n=2 Tax=Corynebacterium cystitidis TaxID=35757 RepID=A0A1H9WBQ1_9CORY|nr:Nucleoside triphosphate pyrophosphohydrolase [Corynebacterium cystitidis DSM 20524]SES31201.1 XTP/dITP diphosphohydrolase [Corynebacterium cystitidis DSM 20524]SNV68070.1 hypothatical protein [Corynebacterium cystitidis]
MLFMTVILLDPRWPDQIPMGVVSSLESPITCTGEVPVSVRWVLADLPARDSVTGWGTLLTTDAQAPEVLKRRQRGEALIEVPSRQDKVQQAVETMRIARNRGAWEIAQTHESLLPYLREEAQEFCEAVEQGLNDDQLCNELGDVLLQVLFHAEIASRRGAFDFGDVAESFTNKMRSRSPYFFDGSTGIVDEETQDRLWQEAKQKE